MGIGDFALGFATTSADELQKQRDRTRQAEDLQLQQQMDLVHELMRRPDFNVNLMGQALTDLANLGAAKGGRGKLKGGMEGFQGAHELPLSQMLRGMSGGQRPIQGPTSTLQTDSAGAFPMTGAGQMSPTQLPGQVGPAESIPGVPLPMPPEGMAQAPSQTRRALPLEQQPYLRPPAELEMERDQGELQSLIALGIDPAQAKLAIAEKHGLKVPGGAGGLRMGTPKEFEIPEADGSKTRILASPQQLPDGTIRWVDQYSRPLHPNARPVDKPGSMGGTLKDEHGNFWQRNPDGTATMIRDAAGNPVKGAVAGGSGHVIQGSYKDAQGVDHPAAIIIHNDGSITKAQPYEGLFGPDQAAPDASSLPSAPPQGAATLPPAPITDSGSDQFYPNPAPSGSPTPPAMAVPGATWYMPDGRVAVLNDSGRWIAPSGPGGLIPPPPGPGAAAAPGAVAPGAVSGSRQVQNATTQAAPGSFTPGKAKLSATADERKTIDQLKQAVPMINRLEAMTAKKFGPDTSKWPNTFQVGGLGQRMKYEAGIASNDPYYKELFGLADFFKVFMTAPFLHGVRNFHYIEQIQQHLPKAGIPVVDSPVLIQDKLNIIKQNINDMLGEYGEQQPFQKQQ